MPSIRHLAAAFAIAASSLLASVHGVDARSSAPVAVIAAANGSPLQTLINQDRAAANLPPLAWSPCLASVALQNAQRIANQGYLSHTNGPTVDLGCGVGSTSAGENVAYISSGVDDSQVNTMYMNSAPHRANILGAYNFVGTAWVVAPNGYGYNAEEFLYAPSLVTPTVSPWESLGGTATSGPSAAIAGTRIDTFFRGPGNQLLHKSFDGTTWGNVEDLGGGLTGDPASVSWGTGRVDVFVRGMDNGLWHRALQNNVWSGWEGFGGVMTESPAVASWGSGHLDVFVRGTDRGLWRITYNAGAWGQWSNAAGAGGVLGTKPAAVSWGTGRVDVFAGGMDGGLWHLAIDGSTVSAWESLGGVLGAGPATSSPAAGRVDVFVRSTDGRLWHRWWAGSWLPWTDADNANGSFQNAPAAVAVAGGPTHIFVRGGDNTIYHEVVQTP